MAEATQPIKSSEAHPYKTFDNGSSHETAPTERILRKTTTHEIIQRTFTTEPQRRISRGCQTVRNRCIGFITTMKTKYGCTREIPLEEAKRIFQLDMGIWDRASLKAYFGTQLGVSRRIIQRTARYQTGTISNKTIELKQNISKLEGYLERLGLVKFEKRGNTWFMVLNNEVSVIPEIAKSTQSVNESSEQNLRLNYVKRGCSIDNFSLTPIALGEQHGHELNVKTEDNGEKRESVIGCERNRSSESEREEHELSEFSQKTWLTASERADLEKRDRKRLEISDAELLPSLEKTAKK